MGSPPEQWKRIALWVVPRSRSNAFLRSMVNRPGTKGFLEPFLDAYYFGPERVSPRYKERGIVRDKTFNEAKLRCEKYYPGYDVVFIKELAYFFAGRMEPSFKDMPSGLVHTFLIRDPLNAAKSNYKMCQTSEQPEWRTFLVEEFGYKEQYEMCKFVTEQLQQPAIIVESDDLIQRPEAMLRKYCSAVGITFHEQMLKWSNDPKYMEPFAMDPIWSEWYGTVTKLNGFEPNLPEHDIELPDYIVRAVDECKPLYKEMYAQRMKLD